MSYYLSKQQTSTNPVLQLVAPHAALVTLLQLAESGNSSSSNLTNSLTKPHLTLMSFAALTSRLPVWRVFRISICVLAFEFENWNANWGSNQQDCHSQLETHILGTP